MSDILVEKIRKENYLLDIFEHTKNSAYVRAAKNIIEFLSVELYRSIEPSHYTGKIIVFQSINHPISFEENSQEEFYDKGLLNNSYQSLIFSLRGKDKSPLIWNNIESESISKLLNSAKHFIAYIFDGQTKNELFIVNKHEISIPNYFSCPSIFALQYHYLSEVLLEYKNEKVKTVSCEILKSCWADERHIYFKNKPEECMQKSLKEYLDKLKGVTVVREYNLGASKPVDVRVYWREANRAALIELKWIGKSLKKDGKLGTSYSNTRANEGIGQIKEYIDLERGDTPSIITKGYLVVIDGRRKNISTKKVDTISKKDGMHYANKELEIDDDKRYWETYSNIEKVDRMFVEPICEK